MTEYLQKPAKLASHDMYRVVFKGYPDIMDVKQISEILEVSTKTVYKLIRANLLSAMKVGREFRIPKISLLTYIGMMETKYAES